jgi:hypothetical protein
MARKAEDWRLAASREALATLIKLSSKISQFQTIASAAR